MTAGTFLQVSAGDVHALAVCDDGRLFAWGSERSPEGLGDGRLGVDEKHARGGCRLPAPVRLPPDVRVRQASAGDFHSLAVTTDGAVLSWGDGSHGKLALPEPSLNLP